VVARARIDAALAHILRIKNRVLSLVKRRDADVEARDGATFYSSLQLKFKIERLPLRIIAGCMPIQMTWMRLVLFFAKRC